MLRVGLTGGIATGKSTLAWVFEDLGAKVIDADLIAHQLQRPGARIWREIVEAFGEEILRPDRTIDRRRLGGIVFSDRERRLVLERIMHPSIFAREEELLTEWERGGRVDLAVVEEALMIEGGSFRRFHRLVVVVAEEGVQLERLKRKGWTEQEARARIDSQMPLSEKARFADYLVDNSGDRAALVQEGRRIFEALQQEARGGGNPAARDVESLPPPWMSEDSRP